MGDAEELCALAVHARKVVCSSGREEERMKKGALLVMDWRGMSCFWLGFSISRDSNFPGICISLQVFVPFLVLVISCNYIRHRQNVKSEDQIQAVSYCGSCVIWISLLQICHWCILNWSMCKSFNSTVGPFTAKVIRELIWFVKQGVSSKYAWSHWTMQMGSLIPSGNPPFSVAHFSQQARVWYMIIKKIIEL